MNTKTLYGTGRQILRTNAFVSLAGNGLSAVLGLLTLGLLARVCSKEEFGKWILFLTVYSLTDTLRSGLILNALIRQLAADTTTTMIRRWAGAAWQLSVILLGLMSLLILGMATLSGLLGYSTQWSALAGWLIGLSVVALPVNISGWLLQARSRFKAMQAVRISVQILFLICILFGYYKDRLDSNYLLATYVISHTLISVYVLVSGWAKADTLLEGTARERRNLLDFGRFSMGTLLISNLLRSSDRLLIGMFMGPEAVGIYALPQRLIEVIEMPIRSIVITDMPRLAQLYASQSPTAWATFFNRKAGQLWLLILPLSVGGFLAARPLVNLLGGIDYGDSSSVLRFFMIYALFLPLERYSGVGLDVANKPQFNLLKVICMLGINLVGDLVAIAVFKSVVGVAFVSIATFLVGLLLGFRFLRAYAPVSLLGSVQASWATIQQSINHIRHEWARQL